MTETLDEHEPFDALDAFETLDIPAARGPFIRAAAPALPARVIVTNVDIPFSRMFQVTLKWTCAAMLALCIVAAAGALLGFCAFEAFSAVRSSLH